MLESAITQGKDNYFLNNKLSRWTYKPAEVVLVYSKFVTSFIKFCLLDS